MANMAQGEASFTTHDDRTFTLVIDFPALAEAEYAVDMGVDDILKGLRLGRLKAMRGMTFGALSAKHPDISMDQVDAIIMHEGDSAELGKAMAIAMKGAFPAATEGDNPGNAARAPGSTGTGSRATGRRKASSRKPSGGKPRAPTK